MLNYQEEKYNKILNYLVYILITIIIISLIHGYSCKYLTSTSCKDVDFLRNFMENLNFMQVEYLI